MTKSYTVHELDSEDTPDKFKDSKQFISNSKDSKQNHPIKSKRSSRNFTMLNIEASVLGNNIQSNSPPSRRLSDSPIMPPKKSKHYRRTSTEVDDCNWGAVKNESSNDDSPRNFSQYGQGEILQEQDSSNLDRLDQDLTVNMSRYGPGNNRKMYESICPEGFSAGMSHAMNLVNDFQDRSPSNTYELQVPGRFPIPAKSPTPMADIGRSRKNIFSSFVGN